jgi:hypothetical protein
MTNGIKRMCRCFQILRRLVKYGIVALTVLCTLHCGLLFAGYDFLSVHVLLCAFIFTVCICLSQLFNLCWVHKACVVYICAVMMCVIFNRHDVFGNLEINLNAMRVLMCYAGLGIIGLLVWRAREKSC